MSLGVLRACGGQWRRRGRGVPVEAMPGPAGRRGVGTHSLVRGPAGASQASLPGAPSSPSPALDTPLTHFLCVEAETFPRLPLLDTPWGPAGATALGPSWPRALTRRPQGSQAALPASRRSPCPARAGAAPRGRGPAGAWPDAAAGMRCLGGPGVCTRISLLFAPAPVFLSISHRLCGLPAAPPSVFGGGVSGEGCPENPGGWGWGGCWDSAWEPGWGPFSESRSSGQAPPPPTCAGRPSASRGAPARTSEAPRRLAVGGAGGTESGPDSSSPLIGGAGRSGTPPPGSRRAAG